jgi:phosphocarrier protein HPr
MLQKELIVQNKLGLHARAAAKFVQCATEFSCAVEVIKGDLRVNGKSIMGVLLLAAPMGTHLEVVLDGPDEEEALLALEALIEDKFGEE